MTLVAKVEDTIMNLNKEDAKKAEAIRKAERLSDIYEDVKPKPFVVTAEQYFGLPAFSK